MKISVVLNKKLSECDFCGYELNNSTLEKCPKCNFTGQGTSEEKEKFRSENVELERLVQEADSALSWARFGMLWPWLTVIAIGLFYFLRKPVNISACLSLTAISCIFIACYFAVQKKPIPILAMAFICLLLIISFGVFAMSILLSTTIYWTPLIIPAILLLMYGNALYLNVKLEKKLSGNRNK